MKNSPSRRILCVDDEPNVLEGLARILGFDYDLITETSGSKGLVTLRHEGPFAVVISDMRMPEMDGAAFLRHVHKEVPETVRVLLTGHADINSAIAAVNEGQIFRFLTKPCSPEILRKTLEAAIEQYRLITAERELLERTLSGSVSVLTEILGLVNPAAFSKASRIKRYVTHMTEKLDLPNRWQFEIAAMLSQIGCVTLSPDIMEKVYASQQLSTEETKTFLAHPVVARRLIEKIPRLEIIAQMIEGQQQAEIGKTEAMSPMETSDMGALGSQLIQIALDYDQLVMGGLKHEEAIEKMWKKNKDTPETLLTALAHFPESHTSFACKAILIRELGTGMILNEDVRAKNGMLLVAKGQEVTTLLIERLQSFSKQTGIKEPFRVLIQI